MGAQVRGECPGKRGVDMQLVCGIVEVGEEKLDGFHIYNFLYMLQFDYRILR